MPRGPLRPVLPDLYRQVQMRLQDQGRGGDPLDRVSALLSLVIDRGSFVFFQEVPCETIQGEGEIVEPEGDICFVSFAPADSLSLQKGWCSRARNAAVRNAPAAATSAVSCAA